MIKLIDPRDAYARQPILQIDNRTIHINTNRVVGMIPHNSISYGKSSNGTIKRKCVISQYNIYCIVGVKQQYYDDIYVIVSLDEIVKGQIYGHIVEYINTDRYKQLSCANWTPDKYIKYTQANRDDSIRQEYNSYIFSIDPSGCKDIDDAISIKRIGDNVYELGIHIADVTSYIDQGSDIDMECYKRVESLYYSDEIRHMMAARLSCDAISLIKGERKRAYSIIVTIDNDNIVNTEIRKLWISVDDNYSYDAIDDIANNIIQSEHRNDIMNGYNIIRNVIRKSLNITRLEYDSHRMVEYCMIYMNQYMGNYMMNNSRYAILRIQPSYRNGITERDIYNHIDDIMTYKQIPSDMTKVLGDKIRQYYQERAIYVLDKSENIASKRHHSLNIDNYAHVTSPIRRYADMIAHRIVYNTMIGNNYAPEYIDIEYINNIHARYQRNVRKYNESKIIDKLEDGAIVTGHIIGYDDDSMRIYIKQLDIDIDILVCDKYMKDITHVEYTDRDIVIRTNGQPERRYEKLDAINISINKQYGWNIIDRSEG